MRSDALPAWPVLALVGGLPLWWVLGLLPFILLPFGLIMTGYLLWAQRIRVVPGVLPWLAFVAWATVCGTMLDSPLRALGYGLRLGQWMALAVLLLYVVNARTSLPVRRVVSAILVVWVCAIVGGSLAMVIGQASFSTPVSYIMPQVLLQNEYVHDLVVPSLAQVDQPWGSQSFIRPAAPFTYANSWGGAIAILTPIAIAGFFLARTRLRKALIVVGLVASLVPAAATLNRGMLLAMSIAMCYGVVRLAFRRSRSAVIWVLILGALVAQELVFGTFTKGIAERGLAANTAEGRARLYLETFHRTLESPILGFGTPQPSRTLEVSVGTQGQIWFVMFSFGFVGLLLYLYFWWGAAARTFDAQGNAGLWLHVSLVSACLLMFYYGIDATMHSALAMVAAVLLRDKYLSRPPDPGGMRKPYWRYVPAPPGSNDGTALRSDLSLPVHSSVGGRV